MKTALPSMVFPHCRRHFLLFVVCSPTHGRNLIEKTGNGGNCTRAVVVVPPGTPLVDALAIRIVVDSQQWANLFHVLIILSRGLTFPLYA